MPRWSAGDRWEFTRDNVTTVTTIEAQQNVLANNVAYDAWKKETTTFGPGVEQYTFTEWVRVSDLASLKWEDSSGGQTRPGYYHEPCAFLQWPLVDGAAWHVKCTATYDNGDGYPFDYDIEQDVKVNGTRTTTVGAGTFTALMVETREGDDSVSYAWWAPEACTHVKVLEGSPPRPLSLVKFGCAKAAAPLGGATNATTGGTTNATTNTTQQTTTTTTTTTTTNERPGPIPGRFDYACSAQRVQWPNMTEAECDAFDADGDGETTKEENRVGTNPDDPDTDQDGVSDHDDRAALDSGKSSPGAGLLAALGAIALAAFMVSRRK